MTKATKKSKAAKVKERQERRFVPMAAAEPVVVNAFGALGAAALGAGTWGQFGHQLMGSELPPFAYAPALLAGGAVAFAASVWLGTSGDAVLRVGSGGIGIENAKDVVRIPWYGIERIVWDPERQTLSVRGKDDLGTERNLSLTPKVQPGAIAWIVKEARARIPDDVDVPDEARGLPTAATGDGELLVMDAVQVVGKRCAESDRIIAYEPDARVCPRCERVYYKLSVPDACECGASLTALQASPEAAAGAPSKEASPGDS